MKPIERAIATHNPTLIYTHHSGDLNIDHRRIHEAVVTAARPIPDSGVQTLLFFEVPSRQVPGASSPFVPNWFIDIAAILEQKLAALDAYASEMSPFPIRDRAKQSQPFAEPAPECRPQRPFAWVDTDFFSPSAAQSSRISTQNISTQR